MKQKEVRTEDKKDLRWTMENRKKEKETRENRRKVKDIVPRRFHKWLKIFGKQKSE